MVSEIILEENNIDNQIDNRNEIFIKLSTKKWEYISLFLLVFGFILTLIGFWEIETILWNRIIYTTGSQWKNVNPIYLNTPISTIISLLIKNIIYYFLGNYLIILSTAIMINQLLKRKSWSKKSKYFSALLLVFGLAAALMGWWLKYSFNVIENLVVIKDLESVEVGYEWIRVELGVYSAIIEVISLIFWISSLILSIIIGYVIFKLWHQNRLRNLKNVSLLNKEEGKEKSLNNSFKSFLQNLAKNIPFYLIILGYLAFTLFPVYLAIMSSFSTPDEISSGKPPNDPLETMILNYSSVLFVVQKATPSFRTALAISLFLGIGTSVISLLISVTSAYALARIKFKGKTVLTFVILSTQMFPAIILLIPQFVIMSELGLLARNVVLFGVLLIMATGATAYVTWMMKGYFETIPPDIEEAAYIDGYGRFSTFIKIVIPLAKSGMVAVMVFTFLTAWQEFVLARTFIGQSDPRATLPLLFYQYQDLTAPDVPTFYELLSPYAIIVAAPPVIFYMILQKQLVGGVVAGAVK